MEECCKQREQPVCWLWGRKTVNRKPASVTGTWGTKSGWCQAEADLHKVFGYRTLFQKQLEATEESAGGKLDA